MGLDVSIYYSSKEIAKIKQLATSEHPSDWKILEKDLIWENQSRQELVNLHDYLISIAEDVDDTNCVYIPIRHSIKEIKEDYVNFLLTSEGLGKHSIALKYLKDILDKLNEKQDTNKTIYYYAWF